MMSWRNLEGNHENCGEREMEVSWLPETSDYGIADVVCVAGKNPDDEKVLDYCMKVEGGIGCPNLIPIAMIAGKPGEVVGKRRYQPHLEIIRCQLKI